MILKNKKILIFVSGSIAIYKVLYLIRLIIKEGAMVKVVTTDVALSFIGAKSFESISQNKILCTQTEDWISDINHIQYAKWADVAVFAPLSFNSLAKLAHGLADNVYLSCALALRTKNKLIAPSGNTFMLNNVATQKNIQTMKDLGYEIMQPEFGNLVCGENGNGAMANENEILFSIKRSIFRNDFWQNRCVIVTGGGSVEEIDDIRSISNKSSGLQSSNLALALYYLGANVIFISSIFPIPLPNEMQKIKVSSSKDFLHSINVALKDIKKDKKPFLFMAAAISDYIPKKFHGKMKKQDIGNCMNLQLFENIDILKSIENDIVKIGFKAECDKKNATKNATKMLSNKNCHAVCLNIIDEKNEVFGSDSNTINIITKNDSRIFSGSKLDISISICEFLQNSMTNI